MFVYNITDTFEIGPNEVQVGLQSYSTDIIFQFYLNTYSNKTAVLSAIEELPYAAGYTHTAEALEAIRSEAFTEANGARPSNQGVPKVIIVITDGRSADSYATRAISTQLHADGYIMFAVGIGDASMTELIDIASDPAYAMYIESFDIDQLSALQRTISDEACRGKHNSNYFNFPIFTNTSV